MITSEKPIEYIQNLRLYLPEKTQEELDEILAYGEKMRIEWEKKKKDLWDKHNRDEFGKLLKYKWEHQEELEKEYKYLDKMTGGEKQRFIEEYLYDDILYSWKIEEIKKNTKRYNYENWETWKLILQIWDKLDFKWKKYWLDWLEKISHIKLQKWVFLDLRAVIDWDEWANLIAKNMKLEEWVILCLYLNEISCKWAKALSHMKLKEWVQLILDGNQIWDEWAKALSHIKLKKWVYLGLKWNQIWDDGVKYMARNMKLEERVTLVLAENKIWDEWAEAIAEIELKEWVILDCHWNHIWPDWAKAISKMKLEKWVELNLYANEIWDEWAEAIMKNMELKEWVKLNLSSNRISKKMKQKLKRWERSYNNRWINCTVDVWKF